MQDKVFPLQFTFKYVRSSSIHVWSAKPDCAELDRFEPDHMEPNQGLHCQIIMRDIHSSEI